MIFIYLFFFVSPVPWICGINSFWLIEFLLKNQLIILWAWGISTYVTSYFSFACLDFLFIFNFLHFNYILFWCGSLWIHFGGDYVSWTWISVFFARLGMFSAISSTIFFFLLFLSLSPWLNRFSMHVHTLSPCLWDSYNVNISMTDIIPEVPQSLFIFFFLFSLGCSN